MSIGFDTLEYTKELQNAGVPKKQAEGHAKAFAKIAEEKLATKRDLRELELRLIIKIGAMLVAAVSIMAGLCVIF